MSVEVEGKLNVKKKSSEKSVKNVKNNANDKSIIGNELKKTELKIFRTR